MSEFYARTVIKLAKSQVGVKETGTNITKYAADFDSKYPNFYNTKKQGVAWCDMFFDWLIVTSFGETNALKLTCQPKKSAGAGCKYSFGYYKKKKQVGPVPKVGAQIFFSNDGTEEGINHTGIVVAFDSSKVYTIEGNKNNQVSECTYSLTDKKIYGYGYPAYDEEVIEQPKEEPKSDSYKVVKGDTLSKIAKKFNTTVKALADLNKIEDVNLIKVGAVLSIPEAEKKQETARPAYNMKRVTVSPGSYLNVRTQPNGKIIGALGCGATVECIAEASGWTRIKYQNTEAYVFTQYLF